jgi:hypothetical protein
MRTVEEADRLIFQLEYESRRRVLDALEAQGHDGETLEAYGAFLDHARQLPEEEIEALRGTPEGDAVADTILKIRAIHELTKPAPAGGWRRKARWLTIMVAMVGGAVAARRYSFPLGSAFAAAVGIAAATIINRTWLGGDPERRHAVDALLTPRSQRLWRLVGEKVGPSPAVTSVGRIEAEMTPTRYG